MRFLFIVIVSYVKRISIKVGTDVLLKCNVCAVKVCNLWKLDILRQRYLTSMQKCQKQIVIKMMLVHAVY